MSKSVFIYVTYIRTTAEKLWWALTDPEFNRQYWAGAYQQSEWRKGASWTITLADGRTSNMGEILDIEPLRRIVIRWRHEIPADLKAEGYTRCRIEIEPHGEVMKLSIAHESETDGPNKLIDAVSRGWPQILASLKSLLETGAALPPLGSQEKT
ncbi:MAG: SRPBCC family protein [Pseudomonadota bacterium]